MRDFSFYHESFGCQMNAFDTEVISSLLKDEGFEKVSSPVEADVIIVNTCSVREHAENRAMGRLNDLSRYPGAILVVCGCMAQRMGSSLFDLVDNLRIVAGTDTYYRLPSAIREALETGERITLLGKDDCLTYALQPSGLERAPSRYLSITRGCENYCSYCIVPYLRGRVRSKKAETILSEIRSMEETGTKEVTLLGQNVMAYRSGDMDFPGLLRSIIDGTGMPRVRFLTSHPRDVKEDVFRLMSMDGRICPHIHLPVQAGSNRILKLMNRGYTVNHYIDVVERAREIVKGFAVTTDVIVGFPTENENDFLETLDLVDRAGFDAAFTFKYSPREGTAAAEMKDDVPLAVKKERLNTLNEKIREIRRETLQGQLGSRTEILLDGKVQIGEYLFWKGRTPHFRNVLVSGNHLKEGEIVPVLLTSLRNFTLVGEESARR